LTVRAGSIQVEQALIEQIRLALGFPGLFVNLADRFGGAKAPDWMRGMRVSLNVNNLLDSRPEVRDAAGLTPINYQPAISTHSAVR
jgi:hypothetical protein